MTSLPSFVSKSSLHLIGRIIITAGDDIDIQPQQGGFTHPSLTVGPSHASKACLEQDSEVLLETFKQYYLLYNRRALLNTFEFFITHRSMVYFLISITEIFSSKWEEAVHEILTGSH